MNAEQLQAIKERCEKAAAGPWEVKNDNEGTEYRPFWVISENNADSGDWLAEIHIGDKATADFIAHAREDIPALIAKVEQLRKEKQILMKTLEEIACDSAESTAGILRKTRQALGEEQ